MPCWHRIESDCDLSNVSLDVMLCSNRETTAWGYRKWGKKKREFSRFQHSHESLLRFVGYSNALYILILQILIYSALFHLEDSFFSRTLYVILPLTHELIPTTMHPSGIIILQLKFHVSSSSSLRLFVGSHIHGRKVALLTRIVYLLPCLISWKLRSQYEFTWTHWSKFEYFKIVSRAYSKL